MALTIHIPEEVEGRLTDEARRRGVEPAELAGRVIVAQFATAPPGVQTGADFERALDEFFVENPERVPGLPVDFSRADNYSDHD